jgi:hypothetical protein
MAPKTKGPAPRDRTCGNCLHFKPDADDPATGECRANPPTVIGSDEDGLSCFWPIVAAREDWCGKHQGNQ